MRGIRAPCSQADCTTMATSVSALPPSHKTPALSNVCHVPCTVGGFWLTLRRWQSHSNGTQQSLLLIPNTPDTAPLHTTTLPSHSSSSATTPVHFGSVLKDDIKHILNCCNHSCLKCFFFSAKSFGIDCSFCQEKGLIYIC